MSTPAQESLVDDGNAEDVARALQAINSGRMKYGGTPATLAKLREDYANHMAGLGGEDEPDGGAPDDPAPLAAATPAPAAPQGMPTPPAPEPDVWDRFVSSAGDLVATARDYVTEAFTPGDDMTDIGRGLAQGFTFGRGEEAAADLSTMSQGPVPRAAGRGAGAPLMSTQDASDASYRERLAELRANNAQSAERSPWLYHGSEALGALPATIAGARLIGGGAIGGGASMGAAMASGRDTDASAQERFWDAAEGGVIGGATGGVLAGAGEAVSDAALAAKQGIQNSRAGRAVADWAGDSANSFRNDAIGGVNGRALQVADEKGLEFLESGLAESVERNAPAARGLLGMPKLRKAGDYYDQLKAAKDKHGINYDQSLADMKEQGVTAPMRGGNPPGANLDNPANTDPEIGVLDRLAQAIGKARGSAVNTDRGRVARTLEGKERTISGMHTPKVRGADKMKAADLARATDAAERGTRVPIGSMQKIKSDHAARGYAPKELANTPQGIEATANRTASESALAAMRDAAAKQATPATNQLYRTSADEFSNMTIAEELARRGAVRGAQGSSRAPKDIWQRFTETVRDNYGADAAANTLRGTQNALTARLGPQLPPGPDGGPVKQLASGAMVSIGDDTGTPGREQRDGRAAPDALDQLAGVPKPGPKPHPLGAAVQRVMQEQPEALAKYPELQEALQEGPQALGAFMQRMQGDQEFQRTVMPLLNGAQR